MFQDGIIGFVEINGDQNFHDGFLRLVTLPFRFPQPGAFVQCGGELSRGRSRETGGKTC
jgi:hypothetical protein